MSQAGGETGYDCGQEMKNPGRIALAVVFCVILAGLVLRMTGKSDRRLYKETRSSLHTLVTITVVSNSEDLARKACDAAYQELDRLGRLLNFYAEDSEISAVNRNAGSKPVRISPETLELIETAVYVGEQTEGGFDVTVGPVVKLWDFKKKVLPAKADIASRLPSVGYKNIVIDKAAGTVYLQKSGVQIDLGGILKGFAADKAAQILMDHGIEDGIVAVAGDIRLFGRQPDGQPWNIGIQHPRPKGDEEELLATVKLGSQGISTSGDYQRYFLQDGIRYHHLLNPLTGYPESSCRSVTVIAPKAVLTDAFATGLFIMGPKKGLEVLERLGMDGVIVDKDGAILITKGIKDKVQLLKSD